MLKLLKSIEQTNVSDDTKSSLFMYRHSRLSIKWRLFLSDATGIADYL